MYTTKCKNEATVIFLHEHQIYEMVVEVHIVLDITPCYAQHIKVFSCWIIFLRAPAKFA